MRCSGQYDGAIQMFHGYFTGFCYFQSILICFVLYVR